MNNEFTPVQEKKEKVALGILGAFLFSLAGAVVWFLLDLIGFIAALSGFVGVFCAIQGYRIFAGKLSKKGIIISVIIAFLVLIIAWYACLARDFMNASKEWYANGEIENSLTYPQAFSTAFLLLTDKQMLLSYGGSLLLGLGFAVLGSISTIKMNFGRVKAEKVAEQQMNDPSIAAKFGVPQEKVPDIDANDAEPGEAEKPEEDVRTPGDETKY